MIFPGGWLKNQAFRFTGWEIAHLFVAFERNSPFVYATRSVIPSGTANSIQSANMASAFGQRLSRFTAAFRVPSASCNQLGQAFEDLELALPGEVFPLLCRSGWEWTESYLPRFFLFLKRQPAGTTVYTRSGRMAWLAVRCGHQAILERHDPLTSTLARWLSKAVDRGAGGPSHIVATTSRLRDDLVDVTGFPAHRILVAGGGANAALADLDAAPLNRRFSFNAGYAGSAYKGKGVGIVLECARKMPEIGFHLIGPSEEQCRIRGGITENVVLYGRKSHRETFRLLKAMDVLLLPNQQSVILDNKLDIGAYTSPLKLFEYMAAGRPIIASDLPVFAGVLEPGVNAFLCAPANIAAFADGLRRLRDNPAIGRALADRARLDFHARYTWDRRADTILDFLPG